MAIHKRRNGTQFVCWRCRHGECDECVSKTADAADADELECHCPNCQTECKLCLGKPQKVQRRTKHAVCPRCYTALPLAGVCGVCG